VKPPVDSRSPQELARLRNALSGIPSHHMARPLTPDPKPEKK
jgi:hypothetical protein